MWTWVWTLKGDEKALRLTIDRNDCQLSHPESELEAETVYQYKCVYHHWKTFNHFKLQIPQNTSTSAVNQIIGLDFEIQEVTLSYCKSCKALKLLPPLLKRTINFHSNKWERKQYILACFLFEKWTQQKKSWDACSLYKLWRTTPEARKLSVFMGPYQESFSPPTRPRVKRCQYLSFQQQTVVYERHLIPMLDALERKDNLSVYTEKWFYVVNISR